MLVLATLGGLGLLVGVVAAVLGVFEVLWAIALISLPLGALVWVACVILAARNQRPLLAVSATVLLPLTAVLTFVATLSDFPTRPMPLREHLLVAWMYLGTATMSLVLLLLANRPRQGH